MMDYKEILATGRLYEVEKRGGVDGTSEQLAPSFWVNSGSVDVYVSNSETTPSSLADMTLDADATAVCGLRQFAVIPTYLALVQNSGLSDDCVVSGLDVVDLGAIS